jgi:hypothetical protein
LYKLNRYEKFKLSLSLSLGRVLCLVFAVMFMLPLPAQEREPEEKEVIFKTSRIDTSVYYFSAEGRLDEKEGERRFELMLEKGVEEEFVQKFTTYTYIPVKLSADTLQGGRSSSVFPTIFFIPGGSFTDIDTIRSSSQDQCLGKDLEHLFRQYINSAGLYVIDASTSQSHAVNKVFYQP